MSLLRSLRILLTELKQKPARLAAPPVRKVRFEGIAYSSSTPASTTSASASTSLSRSLSPSSTVAATAWVTG